MGVRMVKKKSSGFWYVSIHDGGKRTSRMCGKELTLPQRKRIVRKWEEKLATGQVDFHNSRDKKEQPLEFGSFALGFLKDYARVNLKHSTFERYTGIVRRYFLPAWRHHSLDSVTKQDIRQLLISKQNGGITVGNLRICCGAIFQNAVERDLLKVNPCRNLGKIPKPQKPEAEEMRSLTAKQVEQLLSAAGELHDFWLLAFRTGCRLAEMLGLAWDCVDFGTKQLCIKRTYNHHRWSDTKTRHIRHVDMSNQLEQALRKRFESRSKLTCKTDEGKTVELVFPDEAGNPLDTDMVRRKFYKLLKTAGLPKITIHQCRHTFASLMLAAGAPILYVSRMLGHKSISTTCNIYGHLVKGKDREYMDKLDG